MTLPDRIKSLCTSLAFNAVSCVTNSKDIPVKVDEGINEVTRDDDGNVIRTVSREPGSDTTLISERQLNGNWETNSYTLYKKDDGRWGMQVDLPTVYQFIPEE